MRPVLSLPSYTLFLRPRASVFPVPPPPLQLYGQWCFLPGHRRRTSLGAYKDYRPALPRALPAFPLIILFSRSYVPNERRTRRFHTIMMTRAEFDCVLDNRCVISRSFPPSGLVLCMLIVLLHRMHRFRYWSCPSHWRSISHTRSTFFSELSTYYGVRDYELARCCRKLLWLCPVSAHSLSLLSYLYLSTISISEHVSFSPSTV